MPQKAVQQIAPFMGEKDSSVRKAALNTLVVIYRNIREAVYKHIGRVRLPGVRHTNPRTLFPIS